jgi:hypothetical protein
MNEKLIVINQNQNIKFIFRVDHDIRQVHDLGMRISKNPS